jgi:hypothetical protein
VLSLCRCCLNEDVVLGFLAALEEALAIVGFVAEVVFPLSSKLAYRWLGGRDKLFYLS